MYLASKIRLNDNEMHKQVGQPLNDIYIWWFLFSYCLMGPLFYLYHAPDAMFSWSSRDRPRLKIINWFSVFFYIEYVYRRDNLIAVWLTIILRVILKINFQQWQKQNWCFREAKCDFDKSCWNAMRFILLNNFYSPIEICFISW